MKKLDILEVLKESLSLALKNILSLIGAVLLWIITIWIPYINVGTTIAIMTIPLELSKGQIINPTFIFDAKYRKRMGEVFILWALIYAAVIAGTLFLFIPGIVISFAFSMAIYILLDHNVNPLQAIKLSNDYTYGNKWRMFFIGLLVGLTIGVISGVLTFILGRFIIVNAIITMILMLVSMSWSLSINAIFYRELVSANAVAVE
ncbi:MAG: hypothetical protein IKW77_08650 [Salinivirgaceae bacterium]|nr:hypothetical protein [Salinivirgaceae bacterium]